MISSNMFKSRWSIERYQLCSWLYAQLKGNTGNSPSTSNLDTSNCVQHPLRIVTTDALHSPKSIVHRSNCRSSFTARFNRLCIAHSLLSTKEFIAEVIEVAPL